MFNKNMAEEAIKHTKFINKYFGHSICDSYNNSRIYDSIIDNIIKKYSPRYNRIKSIDLVMGYTQDFILNNNFKDKTCILNFADYKYPGGKFLEGSTAQEEMLCHNSTLFNVLKEFNDTYYGYNRRNLNNGLYLHRALYTPDIIFYKDLRHVDVLSCAAPFTKIILKYGKRSQQDIEACLMFRIDFIFNIAIDNNVKNFILGAWGCGVFGNNPITVAKIFYEASLKYAGYFDNIIFVIPKGKNYDAFNKIINNSKGNI